MAIIKDTLVLNDKVTATLNKINDRFKTLNKTTQKVSEKLQNFGKGLQAFGVKASATFAGISATVTLWGKQMLGTMQKYAQFGDRIDKTSQKIGMSRKSFQEWDYIMSQNGGNVESLQMGYKTLATQLNNTLKGSKDSIKAFNKLGVAIKNNKGQLRSQDEVFNDVVRSLQKMQNPTQKAILANQLFGRSAIDLKPLLNQEAEAIDKLREKANKMGLIISDEEVKNAVDFTDTLDTFSRVFEAKFANIAMKYMPVLAENMNKILSNQATIDKIVDTISRLAGLIFKLIEWFANLNPTVQTTLVAFTGLLAIVAPLSAGIGALVAVLGSFIAIPLVATLAPWVVAIGGITAAVIALVKALQLCVEKFQMVKKLKINSLKELTPEENQKLKNGGFSDKAIKDMTTSSVSYIKTVNNNETNNDNRTYNNTNIGRFNQGYVKAGQRVVVGG